MKEFVFDPVARFLVAYQHYLYYPIMCFTRFNLYVQSWKLLLSKNRVEMRSAEIASMLFYAAWNIAILRTFPTFGAAFAHLIISHFVAGFLSLQITLSHFPMPCKVGQPYTPGKEDESWYHLQCHGTLDIDCSPWMDWFHGGLQFQLEHHLYPRISR